MDIAIQGIERLVLLTLVHWIEIYPMDSVIQPSNNHVLQFVFYYQSCFDNDTLEKEILKIGRCGSRSVDCAEFGHCMLFFLDLSRTAKKWTKFHYTQAQSLFCCLTTAIVVALQIIQMFQCPHIHVFAREMYNAVNKLACRHGVVHEGNYKKIPCPSLLGTVILTWYSVISPPLGGLFCFSQIHDANFKMASNFDGAGYSVKKQGVCNSLNRNVA